VVVFLRGVNPTVSKPWDLPPVGVEIGDSQITVVQGVRRDRVGFVRTGDTILVASTDSTYHVLRGRGDAFFSLTLPLPKHPVARRLTKSGCVELTSATGLYWANAHLFVSDIPYYSVTDREGRFSFDGVPPTQVEAVAWIPGWQTSRTERDPDSTQVARHKYSAPIERVARTAVSAGQTVNLRISLGAP
jgi:hypothetical protein